MPTIDLKGWALVHIYHESHGDHSTYIYQKEGMIKLHGRNNVLLLNVVKYRDDHRTDHLYMEDGRFTHDYLLAKELLEDPASKNVKHTISPCCTAGYNDIERSGKRYRITSVAGHGTWLSSLGTMISILTYNCTNDERSTTWL